MSVLQGDGGGGYGFDRYGHLWFFGGRAGNSQEIASKQAKTVRFFFYLPAALAQVHEVGSEGRR